MPKVIQIRNVPDDLLRALKARAALSGQSLSAYLLAVLKRLIARPPLEHLWQRIEARERVMLDPAAVVDAIRQERDA